ncbi:MAG: hypothetical protein JKY49_05410 [Cohaesibacteraceae bacterium]|nr:hypothetical protein [Cohaesibacteraceae bacterium]
MTANYIATTDNGAFPVIQKLNSRRLANRYLTSWAMGLATLLVFNRAGIAKAKR